jgi:hypothetical protein
MLEAAGQAGRMAAESVADVAAERAAQEAVRDATQVIAAQAAQHAAQEAVRGVTESVAAEAGERAARQALERTRREEIGREPTEAMALAAPATAAARNGPAAPEAGNGPATTAATTALDPHDTRTAATAPLDQRPRPRGPDPTTPRRAAIRETLDRPREPRSVLPVSEREGQPIVAYALALLIVILIVVLALLLV